MAPSIHNLQGKRCYLAGAIENDTAAMHTWREALKTRLQDLGIVWMDPCNKPIAIGRETSETQQELRKARALGDVEFVQEQMELIRAIDLRMIDVSDFVVVEFDKTKTTYGTHEELCRASQQNKPVIVHLDKGKKEAPFWWFAELDPELFFSTWLGVDKYLRFIDALHPESLHIGGHRWILFDT